MAELSGHQMLIFSGLYSLPFIPPSLLIGMRSRQIPWGMPGKVPLPEFLLLKLVLQTCLDFIFELPPAVLLLDWEVQYLPLAIPAQYGQPSLLSPILILIAFGLPILWLVSPAETVVQLSVLPMVALPRQVL